MLIKLKNFRCHRDAKFTIPDSGLILLSGPSGSGKSSLIKGLLYALFGVKAIRKPYSFGSNTCSVIIEDFMGMTIKRSNKPNRLIVETRNLNLEDEPAQNYINERLNGNYDEFMISSYIPQKNNTSVLSLSQLEQIRLIKTLAYEKNYKNIIKDMINTSEKNLIQNRSEANLIENELNSIRLEPVENPINIKIDDFMNRLNNYNKEIRFLLKELQYAQKYKRGLELQEKLKNIPKDITIIMNEIDEKISSLKATITYNELEEQYNEIIESEKRERDEKIKDLKSKLWTKWTLEKCIENINILKEYSKLTSGLKEVSKEYYDQLCKIVAEYEEALIANESIDVYCPKCETELQYYKGELHYKKHKTYEKNINKSEIQKYKKLIENFEKALKIDIPDSSLEEYESYLSKNRDLQSELKILEKISVSPAIRNLQKKMSVTKSRIKINVDQKLEDLEKQKHSLQKDFENYIKYKNEFDDLNVNLEKKPQKNIEEKLSKLQFEQERDEKLRPLVEKYLKYCSEKKLYEKWFEKKRIADKQVKIAEKFHNANLVLKERYQKAEILVLESTIDTINEHTKHYLNTFFPDDGLVAELKSINKGKLQNLKIDVEIHYKGHLYDNINQLSGGEFDRCTLASICGINTMLSSPILILDESLASLDSDTNTEIINFLKELSSDKLILVCSHEAVRGIFDEIITF